MSPEQVRGEESRMRARICFPLASCSTRWRQAFSLSAAKPLATIAEAISESHTGGPGPAESLTFLPKLEEIITKALEKDRKLRYQSAAEYSASICSD